MAKCRYALYARVTKVSLALYAPCRQSKQRCICRLSWRRTSAVLSALRCDRTKTTFPRCQRQCGLTNTNLGSQPWVVTMIGLLCFAGLIPRGWVSNGPPRRKPDLAAETERVASEALGFDLSLKARSRPCASFSKREIV
jgi:hypothetical protein